MTITAHDFLQRTSGAASRAASARCPTRRSSRILSAENGLLPLIDPYMIPLDVLNTIGNFLFGTAAKQVRPERLRIC